MIVFVHKLPESAANRDLPNIAGPAGLQPLLGGEWRDVDKEGHMWTSGRIEALLDG